MTGILVGTRDGLHAFDLDGRRTTTDHAGRPVTSIVRDGSELWAILDRSQIWHAPAGRWRHVTTLDGFEASCIAMTDALHVGSSEARLFRLAGSALERVEAFDAVEGRSSWFTPGGGPPETRSVSEWGPDVYVNVHVGGILHTEDGGARWNPTIDIDADVHQVATAEGLVLAATAEGLATSRDRGATWTMRTDALEARYARGVAVFGDQVLVSTSSGPRGGRAGVLSSAARGRAVRALPRRTPRMVRRQHRHRVPGRAERRLVRRVRNRRRARVRLGRRRAIVARAYDRASPVNHLLIVPD